MADRRRIGIMDVIVGQPLPWDVFDSEGRLLLGAGAVVSSENQMERMVKEGMYSKVLDAHELDEASFIPKKDEPSVVRILNRANWMLRKSLPVLSVLTNAEEKIRQIAEMVYNAVELDSDVAVACIFLNQEPGGPYVFRHCTDTAIVAALIARAMGMERDAIITGIAAALTSNLGMLDYQKHLDNKKGPLTDAERAHVRKHPEHSVAMLRDVGVQDEAWLSYVLNHHENEDGSGYPNGRAGEDIPVFAKLIGLADRYCARVTSKDYRQHSLPNAALKSIFLSKNKEISPTLAPYFIKNVGLYPAGSFVKLKSYETAVVVKHGKAPDTPYVMVVLTAHGMPQGGRILRSTTSAEYTVTEAVHKEVAGANLAMQRFWGDLAKF